MPDHVLVAGASGVLGRRVCPLLVANGWRVSGTTRAPEKSAMLERLGVAPLIVDVLDAAHLREVVVAARPSIVLHLLTDLPPALDPPRLPEALVRNARIRDVGTRHLVDACVAARVRRLVAESISFAYAPGPLPYREEAPLNVDAPPPAGVSARGVAALERQVLEAPLEAVALRLGKFYGPGTGFDQAPQGGPVHVDAAADAVRRAVTRGSGIYNVAEDDGTVSSDRAVVELGWSPAFRLP